MTTWTAHSRRAGRGAYPCRRPPKVRGRGYLGAGGRTAGRQSCRLSVGAPEPMGAIRARRRPHGMGRPGGRSAVVAAGAPAGDGTAGRPPPHPKGRTACAPGLLLPVRRRACAASAGAGRRAGRAGAIACGGRRTDAGAAARGRALQIGPRRATGGRRPAPAIGAGSGRSDFPAPQPIPCSPGQRGGRQVGLGRRPGRGRRSLVPRMRPLPSRAAACRP